LHDDLQQLALRSDDEVAAFSRVHSLDNALDEAHSWLLAARKTVEAVATVSHDV
jgi:hypothetical protein